MTVSLFHAELPALSRRELLRYMRAGEMTPTLDALIDECWREAEPLLSLRLCYARVGVEHGETGLVFPTFQTDSAHLAKALDGTNEAVVFAATVGLALDRAIARYGHTSPARALCLQAIGTERTEALCDAFVLKMNESLRPEGLRLRPRFSPGYGDLPLDVQRGVFALLAPERHIGVTLTDELLMTPTKSVTAIAGLEVIA